MKPRRRGREAGRIGRTWTAAVVAILTVVGLGLAGMILRQRASERHFRSELVLAESELDAGRVETARDRLLALRESHPGDGEVLERLGFCEQARGNFDKALATWNEIPADSPSFVAAAVRIGTLCINIGRYSTGESALIRALPKVREGEDAYQVRRVLSRLYRFEGRVADVRRVLREAFLDSPDRPALLKELWLLDNSPQPAEAWLLSLQKADPDDPRVWLGRASLATLTSDFDEARHWLERCEKAAPDDPAVARVRLDLAVATEDETGIRLAAEKLPADRLSRSEILELRALLIGLKGDDAKERMALEQAVDLDPGNFAALERLSAIDQAAGDSTAMERLHDKRVELDGAKDRFRKLLLAEGKLESHADELAALSKTLGRSFDAWAWTNLQTKAELPAQSRSDSSSPVEFLSTFIDDISPTPTNEKPRRSKSRIAVPTFADVAESAGLDFIFDSGQTPLHQLPETMSGGIAVLDYDLDGDLDVYVPQGGPVEPGSLDPPNADRLYRNLGDGSFQDVSKEAGLHEFSRDYGLGVTVGDYDDDGRPDVFITRLTSYALYRNQGDGTFLDVTEATGLAGRRDNPTSAAFADLDNDGDLDLYVVHYMKWDPADPRLCKNDKGEYFYCDPSRVDPAPDHVFRNDAGRFVDVTEEAGFTDPDGRGLGVVAADLDGDGLVEIFVANDGTANFLFQNLGGFKFEETGMAAGVAAGPEGGFQASMGVACGDRDGDGLLDLVVTNFYGESSTLYQNLGKGLFQDRTADSGLGSATRYLLGFGTFFGDFNNDGTLDLATVNGHVNDNRPYYPYAMPAQLLLGDADGKFRDPGLAAGEPWKVNRLGRGLAVADLDDDGKLDALIASENEPLAYFHNTTDSTKIGRFITFRLEGTTSNRDAVGAIVTVEAGGGKRVAPRLGGGSYQSACDPRIHFGLGNAAVVEAVEVAWPSGKVDRWSGLEADRGYLLREGDADAPLLHGYDRK